MEFLPQLKEKGYVFTCVCLSVCPLDYLNSYKRILMKFLERVGVAQGKINNDSLFSTAVHKDNQKIKD